MRTWMFCLYFFILCADFDLCPIRPFEASSLWFRGWNRITPWKSTRRRRWTWNWAEDKRSCTWVGPPLSSQAEKKTFLNSARFHNTFLFSYKLRMIDTVTLSKACCTLQPRKSIKTPTTTITLTTTTTTIITAEVWPWSAKVKGRLAGSLLCQDLCGL